MVDSVVGDAAPAEDACVVLITVPDENAAQRIAAILVERRLAACVNIVPNMTSIYRWEETIRHDAELLLLVKTRLAAMDNLMAAVKVAHPYQLPEIVAVKIAGGSDEYLQWIQDNVRPHTITQETKGEKMLQVGSKAPEFTMEAVMADGVRKMVNLADYRGKWLVLFFYPLDFTFVCPTEITGYSNRIADFHKLGAEVLGASTDSVHSHMAWLKGALGKITYPLASDITRNVAKQYGILLEEKGHSLRGAFIIDPDGVLKWHLVHDNAIGRSVDETLRVLQALQTGDLCPVDWHNGEKTLGKK